MHPGGHCKRDRALRASPSNTPPALAATAATAATTVVVSTGQSIILVHCPADFGIDHLLSVSGLHPVFLPPSF
ncbi:uncharacterized protein BO97DRAFT_406864 [Aspergillus homomorphus CBS 101889]|uniref:Uncharacterized protein n=1 Tax=Aspergillus homomorphus (strain CBS 101889) TaxID=1450537 RepID=A0A395HSU2_ASPHC|nr:hypothetical protein BO97DRAFT_406864 [Aspergillus homomorphus CBS 101889]RAL10616.1 hypothetical protein BO97DRAFT_406864 [Aspergillus homomorphus CBS 101889]